MGRIFYLSTRLRQGRRTIIMACGLLAAAYLLPASWRLRPVALCASHGQYQVREIKQGIFVWIPDDVIDQDGEADFPRAGNVGFVVSPDGVVVINTTNSPFHARDVAYEIEKRTQAPVRYVIDTGPAGDEAFGNEEFVDKQAVILSTPLAQTAMARYKQELPHRLTGDWQLQSRMRGIHPTPPQQTFTGEMTIELAGAGGDPTGQAGGPQGGSPDPPISNLKSGPRPIRDDGAPIAPSSSLSATQPSMVIRLESLPAGATSGDAAVYLPQAKVLFLGDLFENGYYPRLQSRFESRDARQWIEILKRVEAWDVDVYVPDHGEPAGKREVVQFRKFLEWLVNETLTRIKEGRPWEQIRDQLLPAIRAYHFHAPELVTPDLEAIYEQLSPPKPPAPAHVPADEPSPQDTPSQ